MEPRAAVSRSCSRKQARRLGLGSHAGSVHKPLQNTIRDETDRDGSTQDRPGPSLHLQAKIEGLLNCIDRSLDGLLYSIDGALYGLRDILHRIGDRRGGVLDLSDYVLFERLEFVSQ